MVAVLVPSGGVRCMHVGRAHGSPSSSNSGAAWAPEFTQKIRIRPRESSGRAAKQLHAGKGFGTSTSTADPLMQLVEGTSAVPPPPDLHGRDARANWNATSLAFLGDSVWEMYVRRHFFFPPGRVTTYYENTVAKVRAEAQEVYYGVLIAGDFLTVVERDILRWGCNSKTATPARFPSGSRTYKHATALECLVGYIYLTDPLRLQQLMLHLGLGGMP